MKEQLAVPRAEFRSYYGKQILKTPVWNWMIAAYLFTGGLSAGSAMLAAGADLTGLPGLRRVSRVGSLASVLASLYFLIADLGRPERFHHMLRVAKPSSPMSVGTWILSAYGPGSGVAAVAELMPKRLRRTWLGRLVSRSCLLYTSYS
ncbi:polysulfide reductase, partial [Mycolicibacterium elephantis]|uniref:NrfD/PsrC family molybdoenzyme membrane anchor subunit n=1 Tax=Mycolicibacterium elephantis TaxID=81858 RepID=UPI000629CE22